MGPVLIKHFKLSEYGKPFLHPFIAHRAMNPGASHLLFHKLLCSRTLIPASSIHLTDLAFPPRSSSACHGKSLKPRQCAGGIPDPCFAGWKKTKFLASMSFVKKEKIKIRIGLPLSIFFREKADRLFAAKNQSGGFLTGTKDREISLTPSYSSLCLG